MSAITLNQLEKNQVYQIQEIAPSAEFGELDWSVTQRLQDLGFGRGQTVEIVARGVFGVGPYAVRLGNFSQFSLRRAEAQKVLCVAVQAA